MSITNEEDKEFIEYAKDIIWCYNKDGYYYVEGAEEHAENIYNERKSKYEARR